MLKHIKYYEQYDIAKPLGFYSPSVIYIDNDGSGKVLIGSTGKVDEEMVIIGDNINNCI